VRRAGHFDETLILHLARPAYAVIVENVTMFALNRGEDEVRPALGPERGVTAGCHV